MHEISLARRVRSRPELRDAIDEALGVGSPKLVIIELDLGLRARGPQTGLEAAHTPSK